jgi:hypothetical protein
MIGDWTQPFLTALRNTGKISPACRTVGISAAAVHTRRKADPDFEEAVAQAIEDCRDDMEVEMVRRAKDGVNEPVIYQGQMQYQMEPKLDEDGSIVTSELTGQVVMVPKRDVKGDFIPLTVNKRSDALLMFGLKGYRKSVFAERTELTGADGKPLETQLSDTERVARVAALLELARKRAEQDDIS